MALWQPRTLPCSPPHSLLAVAPRSPRPFPPRRVPPRAKPRGEAASWVSDPCTSHSHGGRFAGGVEGERRAMRLRFNKGPPREASSAGATTKKQARKQARLGFLAGLWFLAVVSRGWGFCVVSFGASVNHTRWFSGGFDEYYDDTAMTLPVTRTRRARARRRAARERAAAASSWCQRGHGMHIAAAALRFIC